MPAPVASGWSESPGGACTRWKSAALSRRTWNADIPESRNIDLSEMGSVEPFPARRVVVSPKNKVFWVGRVSMRRRNFIARIAGLVVTWPIATRAQQETQKIRKIGYL